VDAKLAELGQVLHLRRGELLRHIVLPGALPQVLAGLRQSLGVAWLALVVAERFNANAGLGFGEGVLPELRKRGAFSARDEQPALLASA
jgi:ABC-type nitrate/sulfonate/bicarbonate transport system permease component